LRFVRVGYEAAAGAVDAGSDEVPAASVVDGGVAGSVGDVVGVVVGGVVGVGDGVVVGVAVGAGSVGLAVGAGVTGGVTGGVGAGTWVWLVWLVWLVIWLWVTASDCGLPPVAGAQLAGPVILLSKVPSNGKVQVVGVSEVHEPRVAVMVNETGPPR
jgi:hypothetical protein